MELSRTVFYLLRDVAAQANGSHTQLRYSQSAFELEYEYHQLQLTTVTALQRGGTLLGTASAAVITWHLSPGFFGRLICVFFLIGGFLSLFRTIQIEPTYGGRIRLTYTAGDAAFHCETILPDQGPPPAAGTKLPLANIQAIQVETYTRAGEDSPIYGQVQVQREPGGPFLPFAEFPNSSAAQDFAAALSHLTGVMVMPAESAASVSAEKLGRRLAALNQKLSRAKTR